MRLLRKKLLFLTMLILTPGVSAQEEIASDAAESGQAEVDGAPTEAASATAGTAPAPPGSLKLPSFPPRSEFDDMLQRPLFSSSRRPQADDSDEGGSAQELRDTWKLTGVIVVGNEVRALLQERNGDKRVTLGTGMPLDANWVIDEINMDTVIMGSGDEQVTLELLEPRDTTPVAMPQEQGDTGEEGDAEPGSVDERARAASRQLEQDAEAVKETPDE